MEGKFLVGSAEFTTPTSISPSILMESNPKSRVSTEEAFAPPAPLLRANDAARVLEMANNTAYGLSASIFTRSHLRGLKMARQLDFGQVQINGMTFFAHGKLPHYCFRFS